MSAQIRTVTIGCDAPLLELVEAAADHVDFHFLGSFGLPDEADPIADALRRRATARFNTDDWRVLLSESVADLVIVGSRQTMPADESDEVLRRLFQTTMMIVPIHPPCEMLLAYELEMIRTDSRCAVYPYIPWEHHPEVARLISATSPQGAFSGRIDQLIWHRTVTNDRRAAADVLSQLTRDATLLRRLMGEVTSVSATGGASDETRYSQLSVHLTGPVESGCVGRWSATAPDASLGARLSIVSGDQTALLEISADGSSCRCRLPDDAADREMITVPTAARFLAALAQHHPATSDDWNGMTWTEACRTLEITDAVIRSLSRRRTIELYHEVVTEQDTFKSMMAAGGCGLFLWVVLWLMIGSVVEGLRLPIRETFLWRLWPATLFVPLVLFLALQLLQFVFHTDDTLENGQGQPANSDA